MKQWGCRVCRYMHTSDVPPGACPVCKASNAFYEVDDGATEPDILRPLSLRMPSENTLWRCQVCGAEHRGMRPPDICPKCGVGPELWDEVATTRPRMDTDPPRAARVMTCAVCSSSLGIAPGTTCQVCGGRSALLAPSPVEVGTQHPPRPSPAPRAFVVVGSGIAALRAVEAIRTRDRSANILMLTREPCLPYDRRNLTRLLDADVDAASIVLHPPGWYAENGIDVRLETDVVEIALRERLVRTRTREFGYDKLVLATGARTAIPSIPNVWLQGVQPLRALSHCTQALSTAGVGRRVFILGAGVLGLEAAAAMRRRGCEVAICEQGAHIMRAELDPTAGRLLQAHLERLGIRFLLESEATAIEGDECVQAVRLSNGAVERTDLVLIATGIAPNTSIASRAGLAVQHGIVVDPACRTSDPHVFAAGDCAEYMGRACGRWATAMAMGATAGANAAGGSERYEPLPQATFLKVVNVDLCSIGRVTAQNPADRELVHSEDAGASYYKLLLSDGRIEGAVLLGDTHAISNITDAMRSRLNVSPMLESSQTLKDLLALLPRGS